MDAREEEDVVTSPRYSKHDWHTAGIHHRNGGPPEGTILNRAHRRTGGNYGHYEIKPASEHDAEWVQEAKSDLKWVVRVKRGFGWEEATPEKEGVEVLERQVLPILLPNHRWCCWSFAQQTPIYLGQEQRELFGTLSKDFGPSNTRAAMLAATRDEGRWERALALYTHHHGRLGGMALERRVAKMTPGLLRLQELTAPDMREQKMFETYGKIQAPKYKPKERKVVKQTEAPEKKQVIGWYTATEAAEKLGTYPKKIHRLGEAKVIPTTTPEEAGGEWHHTTTIVFQISEDDTLEQLEARRLELKAEYHRKNRAAKKKKASKPKKTSKPSVANIDEVKARHEKERAAWEVRIQTLEQTIKAQEELEEQLREARRLLTERVTLLEVELDEARATGADLERTTTDSASDFHETRRVLLAVFDKRTQSDINTCVATSRVAKIVMGKLKDTEAKLDEAHAQLAEQEATREQTETLSKALDALLEMEKAGVELSDAARAALWMGRGRWKK